MSRLARCLRRSRRDVGGGSLTNGFSRRRRAAESESYGKDVRAFAAEALSATEPSTSSSRLAGKLCMSEVWSLQRSSQNVVRVPIEILGPARDNRPDNRYEYLQIFYGI